VREYYPDVWVVVKVIPESDPVVYRILAGWFGGFTQGDSWKINSGIVGYSVEENHIRFKGYSGSDYVCHKNCERTTSMTHHIFLHYAKELQTINATMEMLTFEEFVKEFN
jgi:hypothetical protein